MNTFKYITVPTSIVSVGATIVAAELVSPVIMIVAASFGLASVASLLSTAKFTSNGTSRSGQKPAVKPTTEQAPQIPAVHR